MAIKLVISGATGRMGQTLVQLLADAPHFALIGGIDRETRAGTAAERYGFAAIEPAAHARDLIAAADVVVDFSSPAGLAALLAIRAEELKGKAIVVGTTGLTPDALQLLELAASGSAVLVAANFSVGVNLMLGLVEAAARVLGPDRYDVEVVEAHHKLKADAPSGTALAIGRAVTAGRGTELDAVRRDGRSGHGGQRPAGEIGFHALRGGDIVGEHRVHFIAARERIEIAHTAQDRALFAEGALVAAAWLHGKPAGRYAMRDVLGL